jgi:type IV pilus assembly protein PilA
MKNIQTMKHSVQKGFTLIELMIVVAIIGILAAIAIPAYQDYTIKSRVSEGASLSGAFKTAIEVYWSENGTLNGFTDNDINSGLLGTTAVAGEYVSSILIQTETSGSGTRPQLEITLNSGTNKIGTADGSCFRYVPEPTGGIGSNLQWTVSTGTISCTTATPTKYLPKT